MFEVLPIDIELLIYRKYFSLVVLPEYKNSIYTKELDKLRVYYSESVLYGVEVCSIARKISRMINEIIDQNLDMDEDTVKVLDNMYVTIFNLHVKRKYDIFEN